MKTVDEVGTNLLQDIICELETSSLNKGIKPGFVKTMQRCYSTVFEVRRKVQSGTSNSCLSRYCCWRTGGGC